jgi:ATP-dependent RNA helicase DDX21
MVDLTAIRCVILDEADEMLNMGFSDSVEIILKAAQSKTKFQFLLFSATVPQWVRDVATKWMTSNHTIVNLVGENSLQTATLVEHLSLCCSAPQRVETITDIVKVYGRDGSTIVFADTKAEANDMAVNSCLSEQCQVLHGDIVQSQRELTLAGFRQKRFKVLIATDVAARGLDISGVDLVIHLRPPRDRDTFIHRTGRTGRAGRL